MQIEDVYILSIEDNEDFQDELQEWLLDIYGYRHLEKASTIDEAIEKLKNSHFDIIIADMRMDSVSDSGFDIMEKVQELGLSSIVIILTGNETVQDCRKAFKMEAWDYLEKDMQERKVFEVLHQSIQEAITYFNRWGNRQDEQWIKENLEYLEKKYWGRYIAVLNKREIEVADTKEELSQLIEGRKLRRFLTTIKKIGDSRPISELVKLPESNKLEFKENFRFDSHNNRVDENLELNTLQTIAAFLNTEGGILIIGVDNKGNIVGVEQDILSFQNGCEEMERTITNLVHDRIGASFTKFLKIRFEKTQNKDICVIEIKRSDKPTFLKEKYSKKQPFSLSFYRRNGNQSLRLDIPQIYEYLSNRFGLV